MQYDARVYLCFCVVVLLCLQAQAACCIIRAYKLWILPSLSCGAYEEENTIDAILLLSVVEYHTYRYTLYPPLILCTTSPALSSNTCLLIPYLSRGAARGQIGARLEHHAVQQAGGRGGMHAAHGLTPPAAADPARQVRPPPPHSRSPKKPKRCSLSLRWLWK